MMTEHQKHSIEDLHHWLLFKRYEPASVIINNNHEVLHATSYIDRFFKYLEGERSQKILKIVVPELRKVLSRLLFQVKQGKNTLSSKKVQLNSNGASRFCKIRVRKIVEPKTPEGLIHIIFTEVSDAVGDHLQAFEHFEAENDEEADVITALKEELEYTKEQLHITIEEYGTSNEELQASNEELQSMNEELRSTMEQLKEEGKQLKEEVERSTGLQKEIISNSLEERWELGAYLHDSLAQILVSIKILVNEVKDEVADTNQAGISPILTDINNLIDTEIDNIRNLSHDIIPIDVEEEGVSHAFNLLMRRSQEIHEVKCTLEINGILNKITNRELFTNLYHITQEAIKNAAVHGEAERISVIIHEQEGQLQLQINDDGMGFLSVEKSSDGMGLRVMKHRVELLGGAFAVKTLPDSEKVTTSIRCTFPMKVITLSS